MAAKPPINLQISSTHCCSLTRRHRHSPFTPFTPLIDVPQKPKKIEKNNKKQKNANGQVYVFPFFPLFDVPFFSFILFPVFFQFWSFAFWFSICFPFLCVFSSLKIIRISCRGEHSPKSPPYVWLNSHFLLVIVRRLFSIKSQLFDSFDPY